LQRNSVIDGLTYQANHLLRGIDQYLDLTDLHAYPAPFYSHTARPSIDPQLMIRM